MQAVRPSSASANSLNEGSNDGFFLEVSFFHYLVSEVFIRSTFTLLLKTTALLVLVKAEGHVGSLSKLEVILMVKSRLE